MTKQEERKLQKEILDQMREHYAIHSAREDASDLWFLKQDKASIERLEKILGEEA